MNGKLIDYYIVAALIVCCIVFGIIGGVWSSLHGHHPLLAFGIGSLCFVISVGIVIICCSVAGLSFDVVAKIFKNKGRDSNTSVKANAKDPVVASTQECEQEAVKQELCLTASNSVARQKRDERKNLTKNFFKRLLERSIALHLSTVADMEMLFSDICKVVDADEVEDVDLGKVNNADLSNEDIFHLGFMLKYYLRKDNDFGASFIYRVFEDEFKKGDGVEYSVVCSKLASNDAQYHFIDLPPSRLRNGGGRSKSVASDGDLEKDLAQLG